jgi:hypothetical protein
MRAAKPVAEKNRSYYRNYQSRKAKYLDEKNLALNTVRSELKNWGINSGFNEKVLK